MGPHDTGRRVDLGHGVAIEYTAWRDHDPVGLIEWHPCGAGRCRGADGGAACGGAVLFDLPGVADAFPGRPLWQVVAADPLTLVPSLLCGCPGCGHHGYVRDGLWVPA